MTIFGEIFASNAVTTILLVGAALLLIGLTALAVTAGRRADAAIDSAFAANHNHG